MVEQDPAIVSSVFGKVLDTYKPDYDYEDRLKKLLIKLAENGRQEDALQYTDRVGELPGMDHLFLQLKKMVNTVKETQDSHEFSSGKKIII